MAYKDYRDIFRQMEKEMQLLSDEVFRGFFDMPPGGGIFWQPSVDIYESETDLLVKVEVPGVKPEEMSVALSADDRVLTVAGLRRAPVGERRGRLRCHQLEIYFGPFERSIALPHGVPVLRDQIKAIYREGFLVITLPKQTASQSAEKRTIPIINADEQEQPDDAEQVTVPEAV
jgi:HSP20 family protein